MNTHEAYDLATGTWEELAPLPIAREYMPAGPLGGKIYVPGGRFETIEYITGVHEVYDPLTGS